MKKQVVIFDFDGVVVDSIAFSFAINKGSNPSLTREMWNSMHLGNFYKALGDKDSSVKMTVSEFYEEYEKKIYQIFPIAKMDNVIRELHSNYTLVIVSGSPARIIDKYLTKYDLRHYFEDIVGTEYHLSKVDKFNKIMELQKVTPEDCIQITDTICDVKEGHTAGVKSIAITWGVFDKSVLDNENTFAVISDPEEIPTAVQEFFQHP